MEDATTGAESLKLTIPKYVMNRAGANAADYVRERYVTRLQAIPVLRFRRVSGRYRTPATGRTGKLKRTPSGNTHRTLSRGGGSDEQFSVFENPELLRAWSEKRAYRIAGIGHSGNSTALDLLSDFAATTPAAACTHIATRCAHVGTHKNTSRDFARITVSCACSCAMCKCNTPHHY